MKRWIVGLVALGLAVAGIVVVMWGHGDEGIQTPGWWMLNQPRIKLLQESVTLSPRETRVVPCIIETLYFPAEENFLKFLDIYCYCENEVGGLKEVPMPKGLRVVFPSTPRVEPYENLLVWITIATTPELEPGKYVFEVDGQGLHDSVLTVNVE